MSYGNGTVRIYSFLPGGSQRRRERAAGYACSVLQGTAARVERSLAVTAVPVTLIAGTG